MLHIISESIRTLEELVFNCCVRRSAGKLALSGLLQFVEPGTAAQVFFGCVISFASFGMQLWLRPYREPQANTLKMLVDSQIFLTFLLSFILRVLPLRPNSTDIGTSMLI